jgi:hypothetical protein
MATGRDPGFGLPEFIEALEVVDRIPDTDFAAYGLAAADASALTAQMRA